CERVGEWGVIWGVGGMVCEKSFPLTLHITPIQTNYINSYAFYPTYYKKSNIVVATRAQQPDLICVLSII
ncbi:MAG TPA: hypothetical protein VFM18_10205, partial [Methanosarcina sp.]|nr:hypothetical protein [Methanosarcina sp.]